jgi:hypothetical protein
VVINLTPPLCLAASGRVQPSNLRERTKTMYNKNSNESIWVLIAVVGVGMLLTFEYVYAIIKMLEVVR